MVLQNSCSSTSLTKADVGDCWKIVPLDLFSRRFAKKTATWSLASRLPNLAMGNTLCTQMEDCLGDSNSVSCPDVGQCESVTGTCIEIYK